MPNSFKALDNPGRRIALRAGSLGVLSVAAIGVLAGSPAMARAKDASRGDVDILNVALGLEHEAIAAYQAGAESGLLQKPVLDVAVQFQGHHKAHRDALITAVTKLGGAPVQSKSMSDYAAGLGLSAVKSQADILRLAQRLERGAANAYIGVMPSFHEKAFAQVCARLAADEVMHWTALSQALGDALPAMPLTFGG